MDNLLHVMAALTCCQDRVAKLTDTVGGIMQHAIRPIFVAASLLLAAVSSPLHGRDLPPRSAVSSPTRFLSSNLLLSQTLEAHLDYWRQRFNEADADKNGEINDDDIRIHSQIAGATLRLNYLVWTLAAIADLNSDGALTEDELRRFQRYNSKVGQSDQSIERSVEDQIRALKATDTDGDGRTTFAEVMRATSSATLQFDTMSKKTEPARELLTVAPDGKTAVTLADVESAVESLFRNIDADGDNKLSSEEIWAYGRRSDQPDIPARLAAYQAMQQRHAEILIAEVVRTREQTETNPACAMPKASEAAKIVLIGSNKTEALSGTTIGSQDVAVGVGNVMVEAGREPIYLVMASHRPTIWRFYGAIERVERLVLTSTVTGAGDEWPHGKPLVGAVGVSAERITFLGQSRCVRTFGDAVGAAVAADIVRSQLGKDVAVIGSHSAFSEVAVPSGHFQSAADEIRTLKIGGKPADSPRVTGDSGEIGMESVAKSLNSDLRRSSPGGVVEFDPRRVVSSQPAERYQVLPERAGLLQLVRSGALGQNGKGEYLIKQKIRFPAELNGEPRLTFRLLRGVPMPDGDPGFNEVISEETGEKLKFGRRG